MIIVDATVVNVAIPTIIGDLGLRATDAEWMNTIYSLVFAALLISVGRAGDRWGRRLFFFAGVTLFVLSSLWAARAWSPQSLIAARFVQGIGGAMILPATLSSVNAMFQGRERAVAFGVWGSVIGGMAALGPLLGGWLTSEHSWRWIFSINLPVGAVVVLGAWAFVPETRDPHFRRGADPVGHRHHLPGPGRPSSSPSSRGSATGGSGPPPPSPPSGWSGPSARSRSCCPCSPPGCSWWPPSWPSSGGGPGRAGPWWWTWSLFRLRSFRNGNVAVLVVSLGEFGLIFSLPLFLQSVLGYSAFRTGVVLVALASGAFVAGGLAANLAKRHGSRPVVLAGMAAEAAGLLAAVPLLSASATGWTLAGPLFLYGMGVGLATAQLTNAILVDIPLEASGQASGIQSTFRQVGSALGIAVLGTLLVVGLSTRTAAGLKQLAGLPPEAQQGITTAVRESAGAVLPALREQPGGEAVVAVVESAFVASARLVTAVGAGFILAGLVAAARLPRRSRPHGMRTTPPRRP